MFRKDLNVVFQEGDDQGFNDEELNFNNFENFNDITGPNINVERTPEIPKTEGKNQIFNCDEVKETKN